MISCNVTYAKILGVTSIPYPWQEISQWTIGGVGRVEVLPNVNRGLHPKPRVRVPRPEG